MNSGKRVLSNTLFQSVGRVLIILVSLITTGILTRTLGVFGYGDYVFITSVVILFSGISDFGISSIGVREASFGKEKKEEIFSRVLSLRLIISSVLFLIYLILVQVLPQFKNIRTPSSIASLVIGFLIIRTICQAVFQTFLRMDLASILEISASGLFLLIILIFLFLNKTISLSFIMLVWVISALFSSLIGWLILKKFLRLHLDFNIVELKKLFFQSFPLGAYLLVYSMYDRGIDSFFLKTFSDSASVGYYGLAYKIYSNLVLGAAFLMNSLFPVISSLREKKEELQVYFEKSFTLLLLVSFFIFVIFFIFSSSIIRIVGGQNYLISSSILRVLLPAIFFSYFNHLVGYLLVSLNEQLKMLNYSLIALLINVLLNLIFIPVYSYWAAAVITVITEISIFALTFKYLYKKYHFEYSFKIFHENLNNLFHLKKNYFN